MVDRSQMDAYFQKALHKYLNHSDVMQMRQFIQHGSVTTYDHCVAVAWTSLLIAVFLKRRFGLPVQRRALLTAALLHDFYLYDWHDKDHPRLHGFYHPGYAAENARGTFQISDLEDAIIRTHMWPLTVTRIPTSREAWIVCLADKYVAARETLFRRSPR